MEGERPKQALQHSIWEKKKQKSVVKDVYITGFLMAYLILSSVLPLMGKRLVTRCGFLLYNGSVTAARRRSLSPLIQWHRRSLVSHRRCRSCRWSGRGVPSELPSRCFEISTGKTLVLKCLCWLLYEIKYTPLSDFSYIHEQTRSWPNSWKDPVFKDINFNFMQCHSKYYLFCMARLAFHYLIERQYLPYNKANMWNHDPC